MGTVAVISEARVGTWLWLLLWLWSCVVNGVRGVSGVVVVEEEEEKGDCGCSTRMG